MFRRKMCFNFIMIISLIFIFLMFFLSNNSYAMSNIIEKADDFVTTGIQQSEEALKKDKMQEAVKTIYNILLVLAIIIAVIVGMVIGIKYMMSSVGEKAEQKQALIGYVVGCIVIFGAFTIWKIVVTVLESTPSA